MTGQPALFLDRDGVINHDAGYTSSIENFHFIDGIFDLCRAARDRGYLLIVVTNQAGIGRGFYTEQDFRLLTEWMRRRFEEEGAPLADVFFCPDHPEHGVGPYKRDSYDRKPNPGMLLRARDSHGLDLAASLMIGDKHSDMQAAEAAGVGVRCQYMPNADTHGLSSSATHGIHALAEGIPLLAGESAVR